MLFPPKQFWDRLHVEFDKGDVAVAGFGAALGIVLDVWLLPAGAVTFGTASAAGASAAYSCKAAVDIAFDKRRKRSITNPGRKRAEAAKDVFVKNGYTKGNEILDKLIELHKKAS